MDDSLKLLKLLVFVLCLCGPSCQRPLANINDSAMDKESPRLPPQPQDEQDTAGTTSDGYVKFIAPPDVVSEQHHHRSPATDGEGQQPMTGGTTTRNPRDSANRRSFAKILGDFLSGLYQTAWECVLYVVMILLLGICALWLHHIDWKAECCMEIRLLVMIIVVLANPVRGLEVVPLTSSSTQRMKMRGAMLNRLKSAMPVRSHELRAFASPQQDNFDPTSLPLAVPPFTTDDGTIGQQREFGPHIVKARGTSAVLKLPNPKKNLEPTKLLPRRIIDSPDIASGDPTTTKSPSKSPERQYDTPSDVPFEEPDEQGFETTSDSLRDAGDHQNQSAPRTCEEVCAEKHCSCFVQKHFVSVFGLVLLLVLAIMGCYTGLFWKLYVWLDDLCHAKFQVTAAEVRAAPTRRAFEDEPGANAQLIPLDLYGNAARLSNDLEP
ncbi:unnamed protein product, partial [Mesorhabditis spiculigera]